MSQSPLNVKLTKAFLLARAYANVTSELGFTARCENADDRWWGNWYWSPTPLGVEFAAADSTTKAAMLRDATGHSDIQYLDCALQNEAMVGRIEDFDIINDLEQRFEETT